MLEAHNRSRFETVGYSVGLQQKSDLRRRVRQSFDTFRDLINMADRNVAQTIADDNLDVLVDLMGHTRSMRLGVLRYRPAPVTAHFLGYPGTIGTNVIDYAIADSLVVPRDSEPNFSEAIARLPDTYQPNDNKRPLAMASRTREMYGLKSDAFVLGATPPDLCAAG